MEKPQTSAASRNSRNPFAVKEMAEEINKVSEQKAPVKKMRIKHLKVYGKETSSTKIRSSSTTVQNLRRTMKEQMKAAAAEVVEDKIPGYVEPECILDMIKDIHRLGEKSSAEYVQRNKAILLNEHALRTKQKDMQRMKDLADEVEAQVLQDEKRLERDAHNFNNFIKNRNMLSSSAVQKLMAEMKLKLQKMMKIRRLKADIFLLESEIAKLDSLLSEYLMCSNFLEAAKPQSSEENLPLVRMLDSELNKSNLDHVPTDESLDPIEIPYKDDSELLKAINRFRDQNLNIVTNSHYIRKTLINAQAIYNEVAEKMTSHILSYLKQMESLQNDIKGNEQTMKEFEELAAMASVKGSEAEMQYHKNLEPEVAATYELCTEIKGGKMNITMMVMAIESFLSELLLEIRSLPPKPVAKIYMLKQMERKGKKRKEEEERKARIQEERIQKTEQRRHDPAKLKLKRRLLYQPQTTKHVQKREVAKEISEHEEEDYSYFFS